jgi:hypothetical protein
MTSLKEVAIFIAVRTSIVTKTSKMAALNTDGERKTISPREMDSGLDRVLSNPLHFFCRILAHYLESG